MRTLLLADDSITVQRVIALTFAGEPIQVVSVGDGRQAMEKMAAQRPDIVLAATTLPAINGYDLAKLMRSKNELRDVPVLLLSGAFETMDGARLASSGADGIIEKPLEPTTVIGRVRELLGLKSDAKPAAAVGRLVTSGGTPGAKPEKKLPAGTPPRAVTNTPGTSAKVPSRSQSGLESEIASVAGSSTRSSDYLDTLDSAFNTLDQQLSGGSATAAPRNPSGPLAQSSGAVDPRSPGRAPSAGTDPGGNAIFEVDDDWFGGDESQARADARAGRREITEDLKDPGLRVPAAEPGSPNAIFEVDNDWFKENEQARAAKLEQQRQLAAEMGIHDVELPQKEAALTRASGTDSDFGLGDARKAADSAGAPSAPAAPVAVTAPAPPPEIRVVAPEITEEMLDRIAARVPQPEITGATINAIAARVAPPQITDEMFGQIASRVAPPQITDEMLGQIASRVPQPQISDAMLDQIASRVAPPQIDDEMLGHIASRVAPPVITGEMLGQIAAGVAPPEISEQMLDQIASRVAERLTSSAFGDHLREQISAVLRDTVRSVVLETSERLVRDEIDRIKSKHER